MDKRREELEEQKADLHLALLMDEYAERMGKQVREEAEAAFERGELELPPELDAKCRALISEAPAAEAKKKPMKAVTRYALVATLSIALLLGTLIAVQAAGIDVFGSLASWSDSVFHFQNETESNPGAINEEQENPIQSALRELGLPVEFAPTWIPDGYEIQSVTISGADEPVLTVTGLVQKEGGSLITVMIEKSNQQGFIVGTVWEKDEHSAETYITNDRTFYIFNNLETWAGVWSDSEYCISLSGFASKEMLEKTLDSIGGIRID